MVGVVVAVGDDDVVHEADAHQLAGTMDAAGQLVVGVAGREVAGRVVVADGEDGGVGENGLLHDDADVYDSLADAASGNPYFPDEAVVLIEQQHPELLDVEVLHLRVHLVVDLGGCLKLRTFLGRLLLSAFAQFAGGHDGYGLGGTDTVISAQVLNAHLAEGVEVVVTAVEHIFHQVDGTFLCGAGADEDGQQLGIAQRFCSERHHFLARAIFFCPLIDVEFFHSDLSFGLLFVECLFECLEFVLFEYAPLPPGFDEAETVAHQLDEGGGDGEDAHPQTAVADGRVDEDDTTI